MELLTLCTFVHLFILNIQIILRMALYSYISLFHHLHEQYCPSDPKKLMVTSGDSQVRILDGVHVVSNYKGTNTLHLLQDYFWNGFSVDPLG